MANKLVEAVLSIARYRHSIKQAVCGFFCVEYTDYQIKNSLEIVSEYQRSEQITPQDISAFGSTLIFDSTGSTPRNPITKTEKSYISRHLLKLHHGHIVGPYGLLLTHNHKLVTHRIGGIKRIALQEQRLLWRSLKASFSKPSQHYSAVYTTHCIYSSNYFHWQIEFLAGLAAYEKLTALGKDKIPILLQAPYKEWQKRWLEIMGYPYIELGQEWQNHITADEIFFASNEFGVYEDIGVATCNWLKDRALGNLNLKPSSDTSPKKVYINRKDSAKARGIRNIEQIEKALFSKGFVDIVLSDLTVDQQISLFHYADVIVAEHGAGLTNILYCQTCHAIEIFPSDFHSNCMAILALHSKKVSYTPIFAYDNDHKQYPNMVDLEQINLALLSKNDEVINAK